MVNLSGIVIKDVCKIYPGSDRFSVKDLSLVIEQGSVFGLLGPNGAGKTTLIAMLCGILQPTAGSINYIDQGEPVPHQIVKGLLGFVPQEYAFYNELTAKQNLDYFGAMYNMSAKDIKNRQNELFDILGLESVRNKRVESFSGGMKRRLNLAIGIIHQPKFLFLDEPTVGVDVQSKEAIIRYLKGIRAQGTTIIYTSHHLKEAEDICDHIGLIDHGRLIAHGTTQGILQAHNALDLPTLFIALTGAAYRDQ